MLTSGTIKWQELKFYNVIKAKGEDRHSCSTATTTALCVTDKTDVQPKPQPMPAHNNSSPSARQPYAVYHNGLHSHYIDYYAFTAPRGMDGRSWGSWLTHGEQFANTLVTCQPWIWRRAGSPLAKVRRPPTHTTSSIILPQTYATTISRLKLDACAVSRQKHTRRDFLAPKKGIWSKRRQVKTATSQKGDKPKRLQVQIKRVNLLSSTMDLFSVLLTKFQLIQLCTFCSAVIN